ncbi:MAG: hypothetical protein CL859_09390 [Cyanobium sp. ARS6]|nr:hypothetical protein [Cyanobium sp. ARS6]
MACCDPFIAQVQPWELYRYCSESLVSIGMDVTGSWIERWGLQWQQALLDNPYMIDTISPPMFMTHGSS